MADPAFKPWKTLSRRTILAHNKYLTVESHTVQLPDGRVITDWPWVIVPDAILVLARTTDGDFLCFRQTKYGFEGTSLAPVGGYLEPEEPPLEAAQRELLEETGHTAPEWRHLGSYRVGPNRGMGNMHLFLALGASQVTAPDSDDLEEQQLLHLSREELEAALEDGAIKVLAWTTALALGLRFLDKEGSRPA